MAFGNINIMKDPVTGEMVSPSEMDARNNARNKAKQEADRAVAEKQRMSDEEKNNPAGYKSVAQTEFERNAGVTAPGYQGLRDASGNLLDRYNINPFQGEASQRIRTEALGTGPSEWAKNQLGAQNFEETQARGKVGLQQQQARSNAMSQLARTGGLSGGARTSLARGGARDALLANQGVGAQGIQSRYGINNQDLQRRQELLGQTADVERQAQLKNLGTSLEDIRNKGLFDTNRYNQQMSAWAAKQSADATRAAGANQGGGGKK